METITEATNQPKRSTFLTVICILSFIGSGWGIVDSLIDYSSADFVSSTVSSALEEAQDKIKSNDEVPGFLSGLFNSLTEGLSPENIRKMSMMQLVSNLLTLAGALMMWRLRKKGFWFYVAGIMVLILAPLFIFDKGILGIIASGANGFLGVVFIVLYGVNQKQMN